MIVRLDSPYSISIPEACSLCRASRVLVHRGYSTDSDTTWEGGDGKEVLCFDERLSIHSCFGKRSLVRGPDCRTQDTVCLMSHVHSGSDPTGTSTQYFSRFLRWACILLRKSGVSEYRRMMMSSLRGQCKRKPLFALADVCHLCGQYEMFAMVSSRSYR